jgi:hypothetical protein
MQPISIFSEESFTSTSSSTSSASSRMLVYVDDDSESRPADYPADRPQLVLTEDATIAISIACSFLAICVGLCLYYLIRKWKERRGVYFSRELAYSQSSWVPVILTINVDEVLAIELSETGVADCTDVTSGKDKKYIVDPRLLRYAQPLSQSGPLSPRRGKALSRIAAVGIDSMIKSSSSSLLTSLESKASVQDFNGNDINDIKKKVNNGQILYDSLEEDPNNSGANSEQSKGQEQEREDENGGEVEGLYHSTSSSSSSSRASFEMEPGLIVSSTTSSSSSSSVTESISLSESPRNLSVTSHSKLSLSFSPSSKTSKEEKDDEEESITISRGGGGGGIVGINNTKQARRQQQENYDLQLFSSSLYESKQARSTSVLKTILQEVRYVPVINIQSQTSVEKKWRRGSIAENMA